LEARRATHLLRRDLNQSGERTDTSLRGRIERRRHARSSPPSLSPPPPRRALIEASVCQKPNIGEIAEVDLSTSFRLQQRGSLQIVARVDPH
jgi:hypothetical protein